MIIDWVSRWEKEIVDKQLLTHIQKRIRNNDIIDESVEGFIESDIYSTMRTQFAS